MARLKILTYNIHKGFNFGNRKFVLDRIRAAIRGLDADIVFLQEVAARQSPDQSWWENQFEYLADQVWPHFAYGKNAVYDRGHHGNAILSKFPIDQWENLDLSTNRFEKRGLLSARVILPDQPKPLHLFCTHLNLLERSRRFQMSQVVDFIKKRVPEGDAAVFGGDFNDWSLAVDQALMGELQFNEVFLSQTGEHALTYPSFWPMLKLDRIYFRGMNVKAAKVVDDPSWVELSDHLSLLAEMEI